MKKFLSDLFSAQLAFIKAKINESIALAVSKLAEPQNVEFLEQKKDVIITNAVNYLPVQLKLVYNIPFVKVFIDQQTDDAIEFLIRSLKKSSLGIS